MKSSDVLFAQTVLRMISEPNLGGDPPVGLFRKYDDIVKELVEKDRVDEVLGWLLDLRLIREISDDFQNAKGYELGYRAYQLTEQGRSILSEGELAKLLSSESTKTNAKAIRKQILETLYEHRADDFGMYTQDLQVALPDLSEKELHQELIYLEQKYWITLGSKFSGREYLNFSHAAITASGIDLVEDPEEFGKFFSISIDARQNHFSNIHGSNISVNSQYVSQVMSSQDDETKKLLEQLLEATQSKDKPQILKLLNYIGDKSFDLLLAIIAGGLKL